MVTLHLHGRLRAFADTLNLKASNTYQVVRLLLLRHPALQPMLASGFFRFGVTQNGVTRLLSTSDLQRDLIGVREVHLVPVACTFHGKVGSAIAIVAGVALLAVGGAAIIGAAGAIAAASTLGAAFTAAGGATVAGFSALKVASIGFSLAAWGASSMMSSQKIDTGTIMDRDERDSALFTSLANRADRGSVVALVYGTTKTGSLVLTQQLRTQEV
jgi:predicted phage tail protein